MRMLSCAGTPRGWPLRRTLGRIFTVRHVLLAAGKWNYLSVPSFLAILHLQACAPGVLRLSYLFSQHLLSLLLSQFVPASAHQPLCIFILLNPCIVLITLWLAFWLFMYLIFPVTKPLRTSLYQSYLFPSNYSK